MDEKDTVATTTTTETATAQAVAQPKPNFTRENPEIVTLEGDGVAEVFARDQDTYGDLNAKGKANKLAGKAFWRYNFRGVNFNDRHPNFAEDLRTGNVIKIVLTRFTEQVAQPDGTVVPTLRVNLSSYETTESAVNRNDGQVKLAESKVKLSILNRKKRVLDETAVSTAELKEFTFATA